MIRRSFGQFVYFLTVVLFRMFCLLFVVRFDNAVNQLHIESFIQYKQ